MRVSSVGAEADAPTATVTVKVIKPDGSDVAKTASVGFYERSAKLGDFVYYDGSYSDILDEGKTCIGLCCYIDPVRARRMAVYLRSIGNFPWGNKANLQLADSPNHSSAFIQGLPNGLYFNVEIKNSQIINSDTGEWIDYDSGALRAGFTKAPLTVAPLLGEEAPAGKIDTMIVILHRNIVLRDSAINLPVPSASGTKSEWDVLTDLLTAASINPGSAYRYYWTAFSKVYAFEPAVKEGEVLADKFKTHNWFIPTCGDMARLFYLNRTNERFAELVSAGLFANISLNSDYAEIGGFTTTAQYDASISTNLWASAWQTYTCQANYNQASKSDSVRVLPFVEF